MIEVDQETQHESETIKGRGYDADVSLHVSPCFLAKDASLILNSRRARARTLEVGRMGIEQMPAYVVHILWRHFAISYHS